MTVVVPREHASLAETIGTDESGLKELGMYGTLGVGQLAEECDMKEEVMETLLSYLEVTILLFCGDLLLLCGDLLLFCGDLLLFCGDLLLFCHLPPHLCSVGRSTVPQG